MQEEPPHPVPLPRVRWRGYRGEGQRTSRSLAIGEWSDPIGATEQGAAGDEVGEENDRGRNRWLPPAAGKGIWRARDRMIG
jgi:hypothetical protein